MGYIMNHDHIRNGDAKFLQQKSHTVQRNINRGDVKINLILRIVPFLFGKLFFIVVGQTENAQFGIGPIGSRRQDMGQ
jgi:hypothetical protein